MIISTEEPTRRFEAPSGKGQLKFESPASLLTAAVRASRTGRARRTRFTLGCLNGVPASRAERKHRNGQKQNNLLHCASVSYDAKESSN
jgi:hypothetical protein